MSEGYCSCGAPMVLMPDIDWLLTRLRELERERDDARKALREIGERAIVDWQDELVGLVSVGLGTAAWDTVTTMEVHVVRAEQARRHKAEQRVTTVEAAVTQALHTMLHLPMCGCDHEQNDLACHVGLLRAALGTRKTMP